MGSRAQNGVVSGVGRGWGLHLRSWVPVRSLATLPQPGPGPQPAVPVPPAAAHSARGSPSCWPSQPATGEGKAW